MIKSEYVCVKKYNIICMKYGVAMPWWFFKLEYTIWIIWFIVLWTCRIFYKIINYRRTPCSSVIVCIPTMLTESHGSSRQRYGFPRNLHGGDTVSTRITPDEAISPDQHGQPRIFWTFQNVRVGIPVPHGSPRTFPDKQGPLRTNTAATRFICRITPDVIRVDPAPIWDWGFRFLELRSMFTLNYCFFANIKINKNCTQISKSVS